MCWHQPGKPTSEQRIISSSKMLVYLQSKCKHSKHDFVFMQTTNEKYVLKLAEVSQSD